MELPADTASVRAWRPLVPGIREVLHARFTEHAYPLHTHDTWTLFVVDDGAIAYDLDGRARGAATASVSILPPFVVHDGRPGATGGYRKRVLYLEPDTLGEDRIGPAVDRPALDDANPDLRLRLDGLHAALASEDDAFEAETRFAFVVDRIRRGLDGVANDGDVSRGPGRDGALADALRAFLDERASGSVTMADASEHLGASPTRLTRAFVAAFGIAPHAYLDARRLDAARDRILAGQALADVALEVGYVDQAHLTRRFKRFLGTTPGRFAQSRSVRGAAGSARTPPAR
jgi:AraC-like DNA-binding protein